MIAGADHVVELGPGGGREGRVALTPAVAPPRKARRREWRLATTPGRVMLMRALGARTALHQEDPALRIAGAREHNLHDLDVAIPLGRMVCVTGRIGFGQINAGRERALQQLSAARGEPVSDVGACERIEGLEQIGEMVHMGQECRRDRCARIPRLI